MPNVLTSSSQINQGMASDIDDLAARLVVAETEQVQPGPSLEQRNQRASVIVVQPAPTENRTDTNTAELEIINEVLTDPDSRDSLTQSPVLGGRRRPRGTKIICISFWVNNY